MKVSHPCHKTSTVGYGGGTLSTSFLFFLCVSGIYFFFLTWGVTQERIASALYDSILPSHPPSKFRSFLLLNTAQSLMCAMMAWISIRFHRLAIEVPHNDLLCGYMKVSLSSCLASPFGYAALKHITYPTVILGKSCKLLPLLLLNVIVYRKRFEAYKYVSVALITAGVTGFMLFEQQHANGGGSSSSSKSSHQNSLFGIGLLLINLLLDGATNSWQDQIFLKHRVRSYHMMFFMNLFAAIFLTVYQVASNPFTGQLSSGLHFIATHPTVLRDMFMFCLCGAMGQVFIFLTIENFGSVSLVTVTVTRKLFTILLSLFWFNHKLNMIQWGCVGLVFAALMVETLFKPSGHHHSKTVAHNSIIMTKEQQVREKIK